MMDRQAQTVKCLVMWRYDYKCSECGRQYPDVEIEVIPSGGTFENMRVVCVDCNRTPRRQYRARLPLPDYYAMLEKELAGV